MHKKVLAIAIAILLVSTYCFAQVPREPTYNDSGKTVYTNLSVMGLNYSRTSDEVAPGYIEIYGEGGVLHYIWIDKLGKIRITSAATLTATESIRRGASDLATTFSHWTSGVVVGSQ